MTRLRLTVFTLATIAVLVLLAFLRSRVGAAELDYSEWHDYSLRRG